MYVCLEVDPKPSVMHTKIRRHEQFLWELVKVHNQGWAYEAVVGRVVGVVVCLPKQAPRTDVSSLFAHPTQTASRTIDLRTAYVFFFLFYVSCVLFSLLSRTNKYKTYILIKLHISSALTRRRSSFLVTLALCFCRCETFLLVKLLLF